MGSHAMDCNHSYDMNANHGCNAMSNNSCMNTPGQRIKNERENKGWSQQRLASEIAKIKGEPISRAAVAKWEGGSSKTQKPDNFFAAAKALGLNPYWVLDGSGDKHLLPSSYTQNESNLAESTTSTHQGGAMILNFDAAQKRSDNVVIRQYATGGAMGHGLSLPDQPGVIENWSVSREWLAKNVKAHSGVQNLCIVTGFGPSMQPMFNPGDPLLVDAGVKSVIADGIYFFRVGTEGFVKQLQKIPTASGLKYIAKSKNPDYDNFEITPEMDFEVLGRIVRVWCGTDF